MTDFRIENKAGSGTVTNVTGTSPIVSSGGATPAISIPVATGSINGYLASTDWTTFNNKSSVLDRDVTVTTISNDNTEQTLYSFSVPGGTLGSTHAIRLTMIASFLQNNGSTTVQVQGKYGATTIYNSTALTFAASTNPRMLKLVIELVAFNATNAQVAHTTYLIAPNASATLTGVQAATNSQTGYAIHPTIAEDSTASKTLALTVTQGTASVNQTFTCYTVITESLP